MFHWLRRLVNRFRAPGRQSAVRVVCHERGVSVSRADGTLIDDLPWADLTAVEIFTTDEGPFVEDVFWVLHGAGRQCVVPQSAEGHRELLIRLQRLPRFNNRAVIEAMGCAGNARFEVWRAQPPPSKPAG